MSEKGRFWNLVMVNWDDLQDLAKKEELKSADFWKMSKWELKPRFDKYSGNAAEDKKLLKGIITKLSDQHHSAWKKVEIEKRSHGEEKNFGYPFEEVARYETILDTVKQKYVVGVEKIHYRDEWTQGLGSYVSEIGTEYVLNISEPSPYHDQSMKQFGEVKMAGFINKVIDCKKPAVQFNSDKTGSIEALYIKLAESDGKTGDERHKPYIKDILRFVRNNRGE